MFTDLIAGLMFFCRERALFVTLLALIATVSLGEYVANNIRIDTDLDRLLAEDISWRQRERDKEDAFPHLQDRLVIVVESASADTTQKIAQDLRERMAARQELFRNTSQPDSLPFFRKNGLLFLSIEEVESKIADLIKAQPLLSVISRDPSLRGISDLLPLVSEGFAKGSLDSSSAKLPLEILSNTVSRISHGESVAMPWQSVFAGQDDTGAMSGKRAIILTQPSLDHTEIEPGKRASNEIRKIVKEMQLSPDSKVRLTGSVALNDDELSSVSRDAYLTLGLSIVMVLGCLFMALRSWRLVVPILLTLMVGLLATTAFSIISVGALNMISVAFAVMFVGIAVDFGIQVGVRFRDMKHKLSNQGLALHATARSIAVPLGMAAIVTATGFLAFMPTAYRGVAELGIIAGGGMIIAFVLNVTLLPALLALFHPPAEPEPVGFIKAAPIDNFLVSRRKALLVVVALIALISGVISTRVRFDADPLNLKDAKTESMSTLLDLMKDPRMTPYTADIMADSIEDAQGITDGLAKLPEVGGVISLASFVPYDQQSKLAVLKDAKDILLPILNSTDKREPPNDAELITAINNAADILQKLNSDGILPDRDVSSKLEESLRRIANDPDAAARQRLQDAMLSGLLSIGESAKSALDAAPVTLDDIPDELRRDWVSVDGRARIEVYPQGNGRDPETLAAFGQAVQKVFPDASGSAISIRESGRAIVTSFVYAGIGGLLAIAVLSFMMLRNFREVICLITPFLLAGMMTVATLTLIGTPLNFANIIALPLLISLGVSYAIYVVIEWRRGKGGFLQSSVARAVLFSAATTGVAFGSLIISSHPGMRSMGELLTFSLIYCLVCTGFVLPLLLGVKKK